MQIGGLYHAKGSSLTASLLTSSGGGVRFCVAVPNVDLLPYFGGSQRSPKEQLGGGCGHSDWGGGRRELWPSPLARAEHPTKPGLTPAWGERGEDDSAPTMPSQCHGSPRLGKTGASLRGILVTDRLGFGCCLYHPWEPQGGFEGESVSLVWAEVSIAALVPIPLTRQQPHQLRSPHSICTALAFNANGWWLATRQFLSQVWKLLIPPSGLKLQGEGKMFHHFSLNPTSEIFNNSSFAKYRLWNGFDFSLGKKKPCWNPNYAVKIDHFKYESFQILKFWEKILGEEEIRGRVENISSFLPFFQCLHNYWLKGKTVLKATRQLIKIF